MKHDDNMRRTLGDMLRGHIRRKYRTQAAAAKAWGCTSTFVARVLSGERMPTNRMLDDAGIILVPVWSRRDG